MRRSKSAASVDDLALAPAVPSVERLQRQFLRALTMAFVFVAGVSQLGENPRWLGLVFFVPFFVTLEVARRLINAGWERTASWALIWAVVVVSFAAPPLMGGLQGHNAMPCLIVVMLTSALISDRAALAMGALCTGYVVLIAALQHTGHLPEPLARATPLNTMGAIGGCLILGAVVLRHSVAQLREALAQARRSAAERDEVMKKFLTTQKMEVVGRLTSGIAHDFNNLLMIITACSSVLADRVAADSEAQRLVRDIDAAADRAALMTRLLLSFGRGPPQETEAVDLAAAASQLVQMLPRLLGDTIRIECRADAQAWVRASPAGVEQVLLNLAINARDAMPKGGTLGLTIEPGPERTRLEVRDDGVGMDEATRARIFEPFFTTKATGTGLGLATVRELVTRFGGSIDVQSAPGQGACFVVWLPSTAPPVGAGQSPPRAAPIAGRRRVLLVEDQELVRTAIGRLLEACDLEVTAVVDAGEGLALLACSTRFDVLVTDVSMAGMNGVELVRTLASRGRVVPVVLLTGDADEPRLEVPHALLSKPVQRAALLAAIDRVCAQA